MMIRIRTKRKFLKIKSGEWAGRHIYMRESENIEERGTLVVPYTGGAVNFPVHSAPLWGIIQLPHDSSIAT